MKPVAHLELKTLTSKLIPLDMDAPNMSDLWGYLDLVLSYEVHNNIFIKAMSRKMYIRDIWDGKSHLFNIKTGAFMTGLLPYVQEALTQFKIPYSIEDVRPTYISGATKQLSDSLIIRQYQEDAVQAGIQAKRGIIWARPRSGKTIMEIILAKRLGLYPILSICQSIDVARQTVDKFQQFFPAVQVGLIGDGECNIEPITIATIQSLSAAYNIREKVPKKKQELTPAQEKKEKIRQLVESAKFVWVDECHHAVSNTHKHILQNKIYAAEYILGCSGTPFREDNTNLLLEGLLGPIIYEINYSDLIENGYLVRPTIHLIKIPQSVAIDKGAVYSTIYKKAITENTFRNGVIARIVSSLINRKKTCMVLVSQISHGKELVKMIPGAEFSYSASKDREVLWQRLRTRMLPCLITTLGDEGIDIPSLDATIVAAGGESAIKVFQRLRCLTPSEGKTRAIVVDFLDSHKYLTKHSRKREKLYKSEPSFIVTYKTAKL